MKGIWHSGCLVNHDPQGFRLSSPRHLFFAILGMETLGGQMNLGRLWEFLCLDHYYCPAEVLLRSLHQTELCLRTCKNWIGNYVAKAHNLLRQARRLMKHWKNVPRLTNTVITWNRACKLQARFNRGPAFRIAKLTQSLCHWYQSLH